MSRSSASHKGIARIRRLGRPPSAREIAGENNT